jgi:hypothetical protein
LKGVIASGLGALYTATGNATLLDQAEITLDATIAHLTVNNILKESCDDVSAANCDHDQVGSRLSLHLPSLTFATANLQGHLDEARAILLGPG